MTSASVMSPSPKTVVKLTTSHHGHHNNWMTTSTTLLRHRDADTLPTAADTTDDLDNLDDLLQHIGYTSPECLQEVVCLLST